MITISLDEYGQFEKEDNKPLFVAGLIFDDANEVGEEQRERDRIEAYYRQVIADAGQGLRYPNDLHSNGNRGRDRRVVRPVKEKVSQTLAEFFRQGTYGGIALCGNDGQPISARKGGYHLFVILKSDDGKKSLLASHANIFARDDYAANRYFHMAGSVVNRILFHNPIYGGGRMPAICLDIATRSSENIDEMDQETLDEFREQSYRVSGGNTPQHQFYSIMNGDIYRTLISQEMVDSGKTGIRLESLRVRSIQYYPSSRDMEFLYLSDSLCSLLAFELEGNSADDWLQQILWRVNNLNPDRENLVFGYDEIDNDFSEAWTCYERKEYYQALAEAYEGCRKQGVFAEHYRRMWFPYLEERIRSTISAEHFARSVHDLSHVLTYSNLDQEKLLYLMQQFEAMIPYVEKKFQSVDTRSRVLYELYNAGVTAFCHIGSSRQALEYYEKCKAYAFYVGVDTFLRTKNKLVVCLEDCFAWDQARGIALETLEYQAMASQMKRELLNQGDEKDYLDEAKAVSQLARVMALGRNPEAEGRFRESLAILEPGSANYKITQSYLLHFYADMGWKEQFEAEATDYFDGNRTYPQRLRYLLNMDEKSHSVLSGEYALYVLARGLYRFGAETVDDSLWERLCKLKETIEKRQGKAPGAHPWELTYKYLELLAIRRGDRQAAKQFAVWKRECIRYRGDLLTAVELFGDAEAADASGEIAERDAATKKLATLLKERFETLRDVEFSVDGQKRYEELETYFTFMYR